MLARLRSSRLVAALAILAWTGSIQANGITVRITEAMSSSGVGGTADWFEITNYGSTAVTVTGWRMDDSPFVFGSSVPLTPYTAGPDPAWTELGPGESAVMLEAATAATLVPTFQTFWNLGPTGVRNPKIATYTGSGVSFSSGGDGVIVYDASGGIVAPKVEFGAATTGSTFYWSYDAAGTLATSAAGQVSQPNLAFAYSTSGSPTNIGSPGIAVVATPSSTYYWTANGTALGGTGTWNAANATWSATASPVSPQLWGDGATAVFQGAGGTVTVGGAVAPLGLSFAGAGYTLAAGAGAVTTATVEVSPGLSATVAARLAGSAGLTLLGGGTLVLSGTANDYTGGTSVAAGTLRAGASGVIPDGSRLSVSRFMTADLSGFSETVNGVSGLGTITLGTALTVNVTGGTDVVLDGFLRGTGDFIVDSSGTGAQRLDASTQTLADGAVKDYSGKTIVQRGTLKIHYDGIPTQTSGVDVKAAGILRLETSTTNPYAIGPVGAPVTVNLQGGTLGQGTGDDVTLANPVNVTADSTLSILNSLTPDPANPNTEQLVLTGPLTGTAGRTLTITASNTTPGADQARVTFGSGSGNTFVGTVRPQVNATARFTGDYAGVAVTLDQGRLDGSGTVGAVSGAGTISPEAPLGAGILTAASVTTSATTAFDFDFSTANADPVWFSPTASENDVLRLTGAAPLPTALGAGNVVRLFLNVPTLAATDTFTGGFFTTANSTAAIAGAGYQTYVYGDGAGTDYAHNDVGWYSLASWNTKQGTQLSTSVTMVARTAAFDGTTPTAGYVMRAGYAPTTDIVIDVPSGSQTQGQAGYPAIASATSVTKTGAGTVVFDAANGYAGPTTVSAGTLRVANADAVASSAVTVGTGGTLAVAAGTTMKASSVTVAGGTLSADTVTIGTAGIKTLAINSGSVTGSPAVVVGQNGLVQLASGVRLVVGLTSLSTAQAAQSKLDLGGGELSIAAGGIAPEILRAAIIEGIGDGSWNGTTGITSGLAATSGGTRGVGYAVDGGGVTRVSFAAPGDTDLSGTVDIFDLLAILGSGTYDTGLTAEWATGDFNYDGVCNIFDLLAILGSGTYDGPNYFPVAPSGFTPTGGLAAVAVVPEPGTTSLTGMVLAAAASVMLALRRRCR